MEPHQPFQPIQYFDNTISIPYQFLSHERAKSLFEDAYILEKNLGDCMYKALDTTSKQHIAIKMVQKKNSEFGQIRQQDVVRNEVEALIKLRSHPNIVNIVKVYECATTIYVFEEFCAGGYLHEYVVKKKRLPETECRALFTQMLAAIHCCHTNYIVHRDVKLDNFLLNADQTKILLCDFDQCAFISPDGSTRFTQRCGTLPYSSPAILDERPCTGISEDVWSLGICLYIMLCGRFPFYDKEPNMIEQKIKTERLSFPKNIIAEASQDLIGSILKKNRLNRANIKQIFSHPWMTEAK